MEGMRHLKLARQAHHSGTFLTHQPHRQPTAAHLNSGASVGMGTQCAISMFWL